MKNRQKKYDQIAEKLRAEISSSGLKSGSMVASANELAKRFQVSALTAHKAINQLVTEGLFYRIRGSGTYLKTKKKYRIGIADSSIMPLAPETQKILNFHIDFAIEYLTAHDCEVRLIMYPEIANPQLSPELFSNLDGLILSANYVDPQSIQIIRASGIPFVGYRYDFDPEESFSLVLYDLNQGIQEALSVIRPDVQDSPVIFYETTPSGIHTKDLLLKHLRCRGIPEDQVRLYGVDVQTREISCYRSSRVYRDELKKRLIITVNDELAFNLINAFHLENMEAGLDYRLLSIGNREAYGFRFAEEALISSIDMPMKTMAEEACRLLLHQMNTPTSCHFTVKVPTKFIMRKTIQSVSIKNNIGGMKP